MVGGWLESSWGGWVYGGVGGCGVHGWVGGWRVHGVSEYTHPPMNSYNVKSFNFINTHPPIKHIQSVTLLLYKYSPTHEQLSCHNISFYEHPPYHQTYPKCHSVTIHILWMVQGWEVGGDGVVGGFIEWMGVGLGG